MSLFGRSCPAVRVFPVPATSSVPRRNVAAPAQLPPLPLHAWLRWDAVERMLRAIEPIDSVLEIGPGVGGFGARLARRWRYIGVEPDSASAAIAARRIAPHGGAIVNGYASALRSGATFDLVCAFEVLEHLADDRAAVQEWSQRVRPAGWMLVSVPAHPDRYGPWDLTAGHYRRYERDTLKELLERAGLVDVDVRAYGFPAGDALELARNAVARRRQTSGSLEERTAESGRQLQPGDRHGVLARLVSGPFRLVQRAFDGTGLGTGLVARGRRPSS